VRCLGLKVASRLGLTFLLAFCAAESSVADDFQSRFKETYSSPLTVKREAVYEFAQKSLITRRARDRVEITFASKGWCDVTVAVEDAQGRIVRHLASGVLGPNAPEPFEKHSKSQTLVWDGKNDKGEYLDHQESCAVRVSLGLRPRFERTLFHSPYKRYGPQAGFAPPAGAGILLAVDRDGLYVHDYNGDETIRLYTHAGDYVRTIYPFPADKIEQVKGMPWRTYPDGARVPAKRAYFLATLLIGRESGNVESSIRISSQSTAMTVQDGRIALAGLRLNRLAADGTSGGLDLWGPQVGRERADFPQQPRSLAFSPDGRHLYLAGQMWMQPRGWAPVTDPQWCHAVARMEYARNDQPAPFIGDETKPGNDNAHLNHPASVAVDQTGRLYVADFFNDRVQVFGPAGAYLKTIPVQGPAKVFVHCRTGDLYVFSYFLASDMRIANDKHVDPRLRIFSPFPDFALRNTLILPLEGYSTRNAWSTEAGFQYQVALDSWTDLPSLWMITARGGYPRRYEVRGDVLVKVRDLLDDAKKAGIRLTPAPVSNQRLFVDPARGHLYLAEGKVVSNLVRIDPVTGTSRVVDLPMSAEEVAISPDGLVHLRRGNPEYVGRFNPDTWREVPFDYGEERDGLVGALRLPSTPAPARGHHGGMDINAAGDLLVTCYNPNSAKIPTRKEEGAEIPKPDFPYRTALYPGRLAVGFELNVFDVYGRAKHLDLIPGLTDIVSGAGLDARDNVYANIAASLMWDGKPYYQVIGHRFDQVGTLVKMKPGRGKVLAAVGTTIPLTARPDRPQDLHGFWVDGAEWFYPGVGRTQWGMDCSCWNSRMALDYFGRSFAPEYDRFSIAVLDANGNLITRVGRYGNVDDGVPLVPHSEIRIPHSIGGDEVALFDAAYVATHSDRRLFISDAGNARILSVRLDYNATALVPLRDRSP
jgi:DNA-binding beta-propeller fold protein YncE